MLAVHTVVIFFSFVIGMEPLVMVCSDDFQQKYFKKILLNFLLKYPYTTTLIDALIAIKRYANNPIMYAAKEYPLEPTTI